MFLWRAALVALTLLAATNSARAERRIALLVGHSFGGESLQPLRYVGHDLERMREVLLVAGGFRADDIVFSFDEDAATVLGHLDDIDERLRRRPPLGNTLLLFYYSGHALDGELRLGETRLSLGELKRRVEASPADLRLAFLDSCRSGGITRFKGARVGRPVSISVDVTTSGQNDANAAAASEARPRLSTAASQRGLVLLTASAADEDAQESDALQGSFFTHFLTSGLRGAADANEDGNVTLSEVYDYAYANTVARTIGTRGGIQHPAYRFDLQGAGNVVLGQTATPPSAMLFPKGLAGEFVVFDRRRQVVLADFDTDGKRSTRLALRPGSYVLKKRETDHLLIGQVDMAVGELLTVRTDGLERVAFADDYAKGRIISVEEIRRGARQVRLGVSVGTQTFLSTPIRQAYLQDLWLTQINIDIDNLLARDLGLRLDFAMGSVGPSPVRWFEGPGQELVTMPVTSASLRQWSGGIALLWRTELASRFHAALSVRLGAISLTRTYVEDAFPSHSFATLTPGVGVDAAYDILPWLRLGLNGRIHYMFFHADESQSLAYADWGIHLTTVLP